jgi:aminomethyltransferase
MENLKKTKLFNAHERYGGKIIEFAGWLLPVQYEGIIQEHEAVRNAAGLFDVSHMGEVDVKGKDAFAFVQNLVTNDLEPIQDNQVMYTLMCYNQGGVVDDLLVYKFTDEHFYIVVNASNSDKDYLWMLENKNNYDVEILNLSDQISEVALQGPSAEKILQKLTETNLSELGFFHCKRDINISGVNCLISRTGYTGEDGFEIYTNNDNIEIIWDNILNSGKEYGVKPTGLGCRDTLRFEASLPLYGNEISKDITPLEASLGYFVKLGKDNFIGKAALVKQKELGLKRKLVGFEMKDRGIPRHGYEILANNENIGFVTTGYYSPTLKKNIGLALVDIKFSEIGTEIQVVIRNKTLKAEVVNKNFYKKNYKK